MNINLNLNKDFERTLESLTTKYGEKFAILNGIHETQLDNSLFLSKFTNTDVLADATIDPNANANHKDLRSFIAEKNKPQDKIFGLAKIFQEIEQAWGLDTARDWLEAEFSKAFYLNDAATSSSFFPYCWANSLERLAKEGLFFLDDYNNQPPKHLTTFFDDVIEFTSFLGNRQSGAVGLPDVIVWAYYFWKKDVETGYFMKSPDYYLRQCFQKFIYRLNQPFMRVDQSAFTNVSIFDRPYLESLFGGVEFPDGSLAIEAIEEIIDCQKVFMEVVSEIREEQMFTFPVLTFALLYIGDKFVDEDFARWASDHNMKWQDSNFFCNEDVSTLSNCPVSGDTKILYWSDRYNKFNLSSIKDVYFNIGRKDENRQIDVISNGNIVRCKINKFSEPADYLITLTNGASLRTTGHHLNKVYGKDYVETKDLTTDDYLPYSTKEYKSNDYLTFEEGKIVGMFLGDGSYRNNSEITFSLNADTDKEDIEFLESYCSKHFGAKFNYTECVSALTGKKKCVNVNVNSPYMRGLINQFVHGNSALEKELDLSVLNCSSDFRRGIVEGLYTTDGNKSSENCNRIYTSSSKLIDSLIVLFSSLGIVTKLYEDSRDGRFGKNPNYTLRWFAPNGRTKRKDSYILDEDYMWIKIKSIEKLSGVRGGSYCLEVIDGSEPVFMLGNGIVTHNCRLLSNTKKIGGFVNSIGGSGLSIGSARVSTINLVRIAHESGFNKKSYLELLRKRTLLDCKALTSMRHILNRNIERGLLPNYQGGALDLSKQYMTIGILGLYEVIDLFGMVEIDDFGNRSYSKEGLDFAVEILDLINEVKDNFPCDFSFNIESIPGETAACVLCEADNLLYRNDKYFMYSNQWIPLMDKCTIQEKCRLGAVLDKKCGGGCIAHINIENRFANEEQAWEMLNYVASQGVIYFAFNTKINTCIHKHAFMGSNTCPKCGEPMHAQFSRVVGFYTNKNSWSEKRRKEFDLRKWYNSSLQ